MKPKIYVSGAISGHPLDSVRERFAMVKHQMQAQGYEVIIPTENGLPPDAPWERHMAKDINLLMECDIVLMLEGWQKSRGCRIEFNCAVEARKTIIFEKKNESGLHMSTESDKGSKVVS